MAYNSVQCIFAGFIVGILIGVLLCAFFEFFNRLK